MSAWQYIVKDNFLKEEHFKYFCSIPHEVASNQIKMISKNRVTDSGVKCVVGVPLDVDIAQDIYNTNKEFMWNALSMLAPVKKELYEYTEFNLVCTGKDYVYNIHTDSPDKLLSAVIYLAPDNNTGTMLYDKKTGEGKQVIPWKSNRAFVFSRSETTWHSYQGNGIENRLCLVYNLRSKGK